jgi:hypothetical protein
MRCWVLGAACCVLLAACREEKAPEAPVLPPQNAILDEINLDDVHGANLISLARGASIVSRTGEVTLENSAVHAIDGDWLTSWRSPPGGAEQTFVISLPARARIDRLGAIVPAAGRETPPRIRFDASGDGVAWREITTLELKRQRDPQLVNVPPFETSYLRVQTVGMDVYYSALQSLIALGKEIAPPAQPAIAGCWEINAMPAQFTQRGTSVAGVIGSDPPMYILGGTDGRTIRATWIRGPMWGPAIITIDQRRRALSGVRWHETVRSQDSGDGWFGRPCGAVGSQPTEGGGRRAESPPLHKDDVEIAAAILKRTGKWVAYGDSALDTLAALIAREPGRRFEIVVRSAKTRDALRARGIKAVITVTPAKTVTEPQRVMADGVIIAAP